MNYTLLRLPDVRRATALSTSEIYRRIKLGTFPKQTRISHRVSAWKSNEIEEWIKQAMEPEK